MKLFRWIQKNLFHPYVLGVLAIVTVIGLFRPDWFYEAKPGIRADIIASAPIFDVRAPVGKLDVLYDGKNISAIGGSIRSVTVRVTNGGHVSVRKGDFDERAPLTIEFTGGQLLERPVIQASNEYLKDVLTQVTIEKNTTVFPQLILDPDDNITLTALVLAPKDSQIGVRAFGKIAGQGEKIPTSDISAEATRPGYWYEVMGGRLTVQIGRTGSYAVIAIGIVLLVVLATFVVGGILGLPADLIDSKVEQTEREARIAIAQNYIKEEKLAHTRARHEVLRTYVFQNRRGYGPFDRYLELVSSDEKTKPPAAHDDGSPASEIAYTRTGEIRVTTFRSPPSGMSRRQYMAAIREETRRFLSFLQARSISPRVNRIKRTFDVGFMYPPPETDLEFDWTLEKT